MKRTVPHDWQNMMLVLAVLLITIGQAGPAGAKDLGKPLVLREGSAWKSRGDGVHSSVAAGTVFAAGDVIWAGRGAYLTIGSSADNLMLVQGAAKIDQSGPDGTKIDLRSGKVLAILDDWDGAPFSVRTPQSVAAVRGTQFSVTQKTDATEVSTFRGAVQLTALRPRGGQPMQSTILEDGQKSQVLMEPRQLEVKKPLDSAELEGWSGINEAVKKLRRRLKKSRGTVFGVETTRSQSEAALEWQKTDEVKQARSGSVVF